MRIRDILQEDNIVANVRAATKEEVLAELANVLASHSNALGTPAEAIFDALVEREALGSTGVGEGIAIPHAKLPGLRALTACFGRSRHGIAFDSIDFKPVSLLFVLLVPENNTGLHLKALARVARLLRKEGFRKQLEGLDTQQALYQVFLEEDEHG